MADKEEVEIKTTQEITRRLTRPSEPNIKWVSYDNYKSLKDEIKTKDEEIKEKDKDLQEWNDLFKKANKSLKDKVEKLKKKNK